MDVKLKKMKMEIKELRIGNYIYGMLEKEEGGTIDLLCKVMGIDETSSLGDGWHFLVEGLHSEEVSFYDDFKPIQLTEEVLLKCGAKEVKAKRGVLKEFVLKTVRIEMSNSGNFYYKHSKTDLQYLHRLQNLYHSLRNEELTYNHS